MNRSQKFALNSATTAVYQIVAMALGLITPSLMIRTYGSEANGLISSINQIISYIYLVEAGLSGAAVFSLYKPLARNDHTAINSIISAAKNFYIKTGYIFSGASLILAFIYATLKTSESLTAIMIFTLVLILSLNSCIDFFVLARFQVILTADQRTYVISLLSIMQTVIKATIIIICCNYSINIIGLYLISILPVIIKTIILIVYCKKSYAFLNFKAIPNVEALGRKYDVIYQQILGTVQTGAPIVIATIFFDFIAVSVYSVYNMVLTGINGVLSIFISGLPAGFGDIIARGEKAVLKKTTSEFEVAYYYIMSIVYGLTFVLLLPFVSIYTKDFMDANYYVPSIAAAIIINGVIYSVKTPQSMLMIAAGLYKEQRWRATIQVAIIVVGGCLLAIPWGIQGILVASICSNLYRTIDLMIYVPRHITNNSVLRTFRRIVNVFINIALIAIPSVFIQVRTASYSEWVIYALLWGGYAVIVVTMNTFFLDREEFGSILSRIKTILIRR